MLHMHGGFLLASASICVQLAEEYTCLYILGCNEHHEYFLRSSMSNDLIQSCSVHCSEVVDVDYDTPRWLGFLHS
jgi:hypothetical protein